MVELGYTLSTQNRPALTGALAQPMTLTDSYGRIARKLRISVTDRCDLRCTYCMPAEGLDWLPRADIMSFEEIAKLVRVTARLGVQKYRLTGGEPLVRRDLPELVGLLRDIPGVEDLAITTNGLQLAKYASALAEKGLRRVNVSLDSLDPERFHQLTRRDALGRVLEGLRAAVKVFPGRVKVNCVALRSLTELELPAFVELARELGLMIRFIEFMPLDADENWQRDTVLSGQEILAQLRQITELEDQPCSGPHSPAVEYRLKDSAGGFGFINSVTEPFCQSCDRIRVTAHGRLRTCLFSLQETNLLEVIREGQEGDLERVLKTAVWGKEAGHKINDEDFVRSQRSMSQIGG